MEEIKKSYHPLRIRNEWNGVIGVFGKGTLNTLVSIFRTEL